ncbi:MAG: SCP2 sterol-binding domain-containing protein [Solirubrobacteraceae bacterium]|nr:SCP2 sterol-binding domain-containing protein [Solirubrobacteraceae bacterium]
MTATATAEELVDLLVRFFDGGSHDQELAERVAFANTTMAIHLTDAAHEVGCTVHLTGTPIEAVHGIDPNAEIQIYTTTKVMLDVVAGRSAMSMAIAAGDIQYTGPVRKFLRVAPILQRFDFSIWRGHVGERSAAQRAADAVAAAAPSVPGVPGT